MTTTATATATPVLPFALKADGLATLPTGLLFTALAGVLDGPLGMPTWFLLTVGLFCVAYGAAVLYLGFRPVINRRAAGAVVALNLIWILDSALLVVAGLFDLTTLGVLVVLGIAVAVAAITALQVTGLRQ
jgi:hypothetical protein